MAEVDDSALDFNEDSNGFFYTNEKQIKRMDDDIILSKIVEKYPDFVPDNDENTLKQTLSVIVNDSKLITEVVEYFGINALELFSIIYRKYSFIFNKCFITKIHNIAKCKAYARNAVPRRAGKTARKIPRKKRQ
jgi:hypothetical protein